MCFCMLSVTVSIGLDTKMQESSSVYAADHNSKYVRKDIPIVQLDQRVTSPYYC